MAKLGFIGVHIIFLISAQKHRLWVLVRTASPKMFFSENFHFLVVKFSVYLNKRVFVMIRAWYKVNLLHFMVSTQSMAYSKKI